MKRLFSLLLIALLAITLSGCNDTQEELPEDYLFQILGNETEVVLIGDTYFDAGFIARYNFEDISEYVTAEGDVNILTPGTYTVTYTLNHNGYEAVLTRTVIVQYENVNCTDVLNADREDTGYNKCSVQWDQYLNTYVTLSMYVEDGSTIDFGEIVTEIERILALYTIYSDKYTEYEYMTNVWTINQNPELTHTINEELFNLIEFTLTEQAPLIDYYNAALEPVLEVWHDQRDACDLGTCELPTQSLLDQRNAYTDPANIILDRENLTITMQENMGLDLGGVSKGYVSRVIVDYLETTELYGFLLNNGQSNVSVGGINPRTADGSFTIAVTDPSDPYNLSGKNGYAWIKLFDGEELVTSGDYQKYYEVDGVRYHHIIDPVTLFPLNHSRAVSIVTDDPALADLYSTAIFNMTIEEGKAFVNSIDGLEAIWYDPDGNIHYSANFENDHLQELR